MGYRILCVLCFAGLLASNCATESKDAAKRDVAGPYQTWDDVITRWVGGQATDLYVELGPPNLHPHQLEDGTIESQLQGYYVAAAAKAAAAASEPPSASPTPPRTPEVTR